MKARTQYHELEWRIFAHGERLSLQRDEHGFYVSNRTRTAHKAWMKRSEIENSAAGPAAYFDAALQAASSTAYELLSKDKELARDIAQAIQAMKITKKEE